MYYVISVFIVIIAILLILIVLVQNSKGGGLAANFAQAQVIGVRKTADFLEKATWTLAAALLVLCLVASMTIPRQEIDTNKSKIEDKLENVADPSQNPNFPTSVPQE
jgi:preprotein translocase subunit SecG